MAAPYAPRPPRTGRDPEDSTRTLFIRNLSFEASEAELHKMFEQYGELKRFFNLITKRGIIFVTFFDIRAAEKCREALQGKEVFGRPMDIHFSLPKDDEAEDRSNGTIFVTLKGFSGKIDDAEFRTLFEQFGEIREIREGKGTIGTRFVEYFDLRHAQTALEKAGSLTLQGHELEVRQAHSPRKPSDFRPPERDARRDRDFDRREDTRYPGGGPVRGRGGYDRGHPGGGGAPPPDTSALLNLLVQNATKPGGSGTDPQTLLLAALLAQLQQQQHQQQQQQQLQQVPPMQQYRAAPVAAMPYAAVPMSTAQLQQQLLQQQALTQQYQQHYAQLYAAHGGVPPTQPDVPPRQ